MPKKAKKSLGRTEEERLVQLQHRVQAEEEMSKKKEEMLTLFLKVNRIYHERASNLLQGRAGTEQSIIELTSASQPPNIRSSNERIRITSDRPVLYWTRPECCCLVPKENQEV